MTDPLHWRTARPGDRAALTAFICTDPPRRRFTNGRRQHPRPWELDVQSAVRDTRFPLLADTHAVVGLDTTGIAAVCRYQLDPAAGSAFIQLLAVATRAQHLGHGTATLTHVLHLIATQAAQPRNTGDNGGTGGVLVAAKIHHPNTHSKQMCTTAGFTHVDNTDNKTLEYWTTTTP